VEELIRGGRVQVNGRVAELGLRVDVTSARITVDGVPVPAHPALRYFAFHKPVGVTATLRDPHAERTLEPFIPAGPRVFPVGRLDRDSEGLLLLTNDGELGHRLQHPRFRVEKEYLVEVDGLLTPGSARRLTRGIALDDGEARALSVGRIAQSRGRSSVTLEMGEGKKREIRRMMRVLGHPVTRLVRVRVGPVALGRLRPGQTRPLDPSEVMALYHSVGLDLASPQRQRPS
jgi:23S rRNA pseudouridine2605 synthase